MCDSEFFAGYGDANRYQLQQVLGKGSYGVVRGCRIRGLSTFPKLREHHALKDKIAYQSCDSENKNAFLWALQTSPMSLHGEGQNALVTENRPSGLNCNARSLPKSASFSTSNCLKGNSLRDSEGDVALSKSSSTTGVAMPMKNIYSSDSEKEDEAWYSILEEDNQLACLHENAGYSFFSSAKAETIRRQKGDRYKAKPKFSIRFQTHKKELYSHNVVKTENEETSVSEEGPPPVDDIQHSTSAHSMAELLEELQHENKKVQESNDLSAEVMPLGNRDAKYSMSNLLEDLEKGSPLEWPPKLAKKRKTKARTAQIAGRRTTSHLGNRSLNADAPELLGSRTSSEDEDNDKTSLIPATLNTRGQTMADIFQEVFSISIVDKEIPLATRAGIGYYGRLQQIMQKDKDRHMEFLKLLHSNESKGIHVKILSRLLDAKLTVCCCLLGDKTMGFQTGNSRRSYGEIGETTVRTIIFSSKMCRNVELEVGNFICIYPPWKEVQIRAGDSIILCTSFSQLMP